MKCYVSVVVIAYNTKDYIRECLNSVYKQKFKNFEIIVVDNASTDGTTDIISEYVKNKKSITYIKNKDNLGGAIAGNIGISKAQGEYVFLMDSDDIMPCGTLHSLYNQAKENDSDIVIGRAKSIYGNKVKNLKFKFYSIPSAFVGTYDNYRQCKELMIIPFYWGKLYKTEYLKENDIYMPENALYADLNFSIKALINAKNITVCDCLSYLWRRFEKKDEHQSITNMAAQINNFSARIQSYYDLEQLLDNEEDLQWLRVCNLIRLLIPITSLQQDEQFAYFYLEEMYKYMQLISYSEINNCPYLSAKKKMLCYLIKEKRFEEVVKYSNYSFEIYNSGRYSLLCEENNFKDIPSDYLRQIQQKPERCKLIKVENKLFSFRFVFEVDASVENEYICLRAILNGRNGYEKYVSKIQKENNSPYYEFSIPKKFMCNYRKAKKSNIVIELLYNQNFCSMRLCDEQENTIMSEM